MDLELARKRALVLGSSRGLGLGVAERLAREGCRVVLHGREPAALAAAAERLAAAGTPAAGAIPADLTDGAAMEALVDAAVAALGGLDILVVNTGHLPYGGLFDLDDAQWMDAFQMVVMSAMRLVRRAVPALRATAAGGADAAIVFIGSSTMREPKGHILSNVMRAAVAGLAKTIATPLAAQGIRVNTAAPGLFETGRVAARLAAMTGTGGVPREEAVRRITGAPIPLGRIGQAPDLADLVAFLASPRAAFITGTTLAADGGAARSIF